MCHAFFSLKKIQQTAFCIYLSLVVVVNHMFKRNKIFFSIVIWSRINTLAPHSKETKKRQTTKHRRSYQLHLMDPIAIPCIFHVYEWFVANITNLPLEKSNFSTCTHYTRNCKCGSGGGGILACTLLSFIAHEWSIWNKGHHFFFSSLFCSLLWFYEWKAELQK